MAPILLRHFQRFDLARTCFGLCVKLLPLHIPSLSPPPALQPLYSQGLHLSDTLKKGLCSNQYDSQYLTDISLREYQKEGINWLLFLSSYNLSGILADDMGLGKTIQTLCAVVDGMVTSSIRHSLIICPGSVLHHWATEFRTHFHHSGLTIDILTSKSTACKARILLVSYTTIMKIQSLPELLYLILDEGHLLRNPKTALYARIARVQAHKKVMLSGTPIQNGVMELWALFNILMPGLLGAQEEFSRKYKADLASTRNASTRAHGDFEFKDTKAALCRLEQLHKQVLPFILRRLKSDVLKDLPEKVIQDYTCQLTDTQVSILRQYQAETHGQLEELSFLRKLSTHPCLVSDTPCVLEHSAKLTALSELLRDCEIAEEYGGGHKALVFSHSIEALDLVVKLVLTPLYPETKWSRIDSSVSPLERGEIASQFNSISGAQVLLLTTAAGGLGLSLTSADIVIFLDHDWNPAVDMQAMDRAHRLGQKNVVNVYRLVTEDTIEETILGLQNFKKRLAEALITEENTSTAQFDAASMAVNLARSVSK